MKHVVTLSDAEVMSEVISIAKLIKGNNHLRTLIQIDRLSEKQIGLNTLKDVQREVVNSSQLPIDSLSDDKNNSKFRYMI